MPKKGSTRLGRSPTPSTDSEPDHRSSKKSSKSNQSKRKVSPRHKGKRGSRRRDSSAEKEKRIPNQNDLQAVDTKEIKELIHPIHLHLRILMRRPTATSPIPPPPSSSEKLALEDQYREAEYPDHLAPFLLPHNPLNRISNQVSDTFYQTLEMMMQRWGLKRFTFDWDGNFDDAFNQIGVQFFLKSFGLAVNTLEYGLRPHKKYSDTIQLVAVIFRAFKSLRAGYKAQINNPMILQDRYELTEARKEKDSRLTEYREFLKQSGVRREIASIFKKKNFAIMGDVEEAEIRIGRQIKKERRVYYPHWWSEKMISFMKFLEINIQLSSQLTIKRRGAKRTPISYIPAPDQDFQSVPEGLPSDLYSDQFKSILLPAMLHQYEKLSACLPSNNQDIKTIFPHPEHMIAYDSDDSLASTSDEESQQSHSSRSDHINTTKNKDKSDSDIEMSYGRRNQSNTPRTVSNKVVTSSSNSHLVTSAETPSGQSNALVLHSTSQLDTTPGIPYDTASTSSNNLDDTAQVEELQIALQAQQAIMDQRMVLLKVGYDSEMEKMRVALETEKQEAMKNFLAEQEHLAAEKTRIAQEKAELKAEQERISAVKEQINVAIIAEKRHIDAVVAAEKEHIDAVVLAEKDRFNSAVVAAQEQLHSERLQLQHEHQRQLQIDQSQVSQGSQNQLQHYQQDSTSFTQSPNHLYPPTHPNQMK